MTLTEFVLEGNICTISKTTDLVISEIYALISMYIDALLLNMSFI